MCIDFMQQMWRGRELWPLLWVNIVMFSENLHGLQEFYTNLNINSAYPQGVWPVLGLWVEQGFGLTVNVIFTLLPNPNSPRRLAYNILTLIQLMISAWWWSISKCMMGWLIGNQWSSGRRASLGQMQTHHRLWLSSGLLYKSSYYFCCISPTTTISTTAV